MNRPNALRRFAIIIIVGVSILAFRQPSPARAEGDSQTFKFSVPFEKGASFLLKGDDITITEIRGTAALFTPGNRYQISGTYTLSSHDSADLAAYVSPTKAADYDAQPDDGLNQSKGLARGKGKFTVILSMDYKGFPHVVFWPAKHGNNFGSLYFGVGDSVSHKIPGGQVDFPYITLFGAEDNSFAVGDNIGISRVLGTSDTVSAGNTYRIEGHYTLGSRRRAKIVAWVAAGPTAHAVPAALIGNGATKVVDEGTGNFVLTVAAAQDGRPCIAFSSVPKDDPSGALFGGYDFGSSLTPQHMEEFARTQILTSGGSPPQSGSGMIYIPPKEPPKSFPYVVKFKTGWRTFSNNDDIRILSVHGTAAVFTPNNCYLITGSYSLESCDMGYLTVVTSSEKQDNSDAYVASYQSTVVHRGGGEFSLVLPFGYDGWPHASIYPYPGGGGWLGAIFFGTDPYVFGEQWARLMNENLIVNDGSGLVNGVSIHESFPVNPMQASAKKK